MGNSEFYRIDKLLAYKTKQPQADAYIRDGNLQIHLPNLKQPSQLESTAFRSIYTQNMIEAEKIQDQTGGVQTPQPQIAMKEANESFESMMEIHGQLAKAYNDLKQLQGGL